MTGEEEAWSHTDLWDFQANVDGARVAFDALAPVVQGKDPELAQMLESRFDDVQAALDQHRKVTASCCTPTCPQSGEATRGVG